MSRPPYGIKEGIFSRGLGMGIFWSGLLMGVIVTLVGYGAWNFNASSWQTLIFTTLTMIQMGSVLSIRSERLSLFKLGLLTNKPLLGTVLLTILLQLGVIYLPIFQRTFSTKPLTLVELSIASGCSLLVFFVLELEKWIRGHVRS